MNSQIKNPNKTPESYSPTTPKLLDMVAEARNSANRKAEKEPKLVGWEVVKFGPCRFIGKAIYARAGVSDFYHVFKSYGEWVFKTLDDMKEYATDEIYNVAFYQWNRYDAKEELLGYVAGRFMKADTPVPENMDYYDIPDILVGKAFVSGERANEGHACNFLRDEIKRQGLYQHSSSFPLSAEIFPAWDYKGDRIEGFGTYIVGFYEAFELINPSQE